MDMRKPTSKGVAPKWVAKYGLKGMIIPKPIRSINTMRNITSNGDRFIAPKIYSLNAQMSND
jgi:hypothetical protein